MVSMKKTLEYLKRTRKALGQLAFNLEDLETHKPTWVLHQHNYEEDRFIHHLSNLLLLLNRYLGKPWSELLSETDAGIVGQCIIPMIPGNSNPLKMYNHLCRVIDSEVNHGVKRNLLAEQKQEYVARSKKFIETLNPSVKLDQSQWPTFLRKAMIDNAVHIPNSGLINEQNHQIPDWVTSIVARCATRHLIPHPFAIICQILNRSPPQSLGQSPGCRSLLITGALTPPPVKKPGMMLLLFVGVLENKLATIDKITNLTAA